MICVPPRCVFPRASISLEICFPGGETHVTDIIIHKRRTVNFKTVLRTFDGYERKLPERNYAPSQSSVISLSAKICLSSL